MLILLPLLYALSAAAHSTPAPDPAAVLSDIPHAVRSRFEARDEKGRSLDCLQVVPLGRGRYLGVYHALEDGKLRLYLGRSSDLFRWEPIRRLDSDASQGTLRLNPDGSCLLAYEKAEPNSVWIRVRYYPSLKSLEEGRFSREFDIPRTLAPTAEGTPSFEKVEMNGSPDRSVIRLRFHYYRNGDVDRAAVGTLTGFREWKARPDDALNRALEALGAKGNIGDREAFVWNGRTYLLQEGQGARSDWESWRIYLYDPAKSRAWPLDIRTPKGSVAFCNPSIAAVTGPEGEPLYVVTLFMPGEGSKPGEAGEAIYAIPRPTQ